MQIKYMAILFGNYIKFEYTD